MITVAMANSRQAPAILKNTFDILSFFPFTMWIDASIDPRSKKANAESSFVSNFWLIANHAIIRVNTGIKLQSMFILVISSSFTE